MFEQLLISVEWQDIAFFVVQRIVFAVVLGDELFVSFVLVFVVVLP